MTTLSDRAALQAAIDQIVFSTPVTDVHTHIYPPSFGDLLLWGVDELLTYHYLVAETMRHSDISYGDFWALSKTDQADLIFETLFLQNSPYSESCRGVLTALSKLGLDTASRDLNAWRAFFSALSVEQYTDMVFKIANVRDVVMTNDPFDGQEYPCWIEKRPVDSRFHAALRIDGLLVNWQQNVRKLCAWGYDVRTEPDDATFAQVRAFLKRWALDMKALYMAVSLPPGFMFPDSGICAQLIEQCVLPVCGELDIPFAMMIGVKKLLNPELKLAGDAVGKGHIEAVENLCVRYPKNRFLVTMLSRENQHELAVCARKFRNLLVFGCWWFLNNPSLVEEITRMRFELLGTSVVPQHSDARVLDQLIYKWEHSRRIIAKVLRDKYADLLDTGWAPSREEIERDAQNLLGGQFWTFLNKKL